MIVYPNNWNQDYSKYVHGIGYTFISLSEFINLLENVLRDIGCSNLAYSGGIDSTIILCLLSKITNNVSTHTMAGRFDHPDMIFANKGSKIYNSNHNVYVLKQLKKGIYEQFFSVLNIDNNSILCCDGIDEFMCGYYDHHNDIINKYEYYLSRLTPDHLIPLNKESGNVKVYLPYLNQHLIEMMKVISIESKISAYKRKKFMRRIAFNLNIDKSIINRNKYGFCDAFLKKDK